MLEKEMIVINNPENLKSYIGGTWPPSNGYDCVVMAFDYLDGPTDNCFM
jgi:hypothetical protein